MDATELCYLSAGQLSPLIRNKKVSPVEIVEAQLARISALEPALNSFITLMPDEAIEAARQAEQEIQAGQYRGPLHGIPLGLKDMYYVKGVPNTSGSKLFDDFVPEFEGTIVTRLREAGTIFLGKTNTHQLAYGITGENPDHGHMHNPWDPELIAGGSSGGSASATASGECTFTMGSDTGGSIRVPGSLCGLAGLKPTYGRLSCHGISGLSLSMDHPGPIARTVEDCALAMDLVAGYDPNDPVSANVPVSDYAGVLNGDVRGLRVGVPREYFEVPLDPQVEQAVRSAIDVLGDLGAAVTEVSWPMYHYAMAIAVAIQLVEVTAYHRKLVLTHGPHLYPPVRLLIESGFFISAADFLEAQRARALFVRQSRDLLEDVDILVGPMTPITAHKIGAAEVKVGDIVMGSRPALTQYTRPFNLNGFPAITVPCGFSDDGLPIGLQIAGRPFDEETVLRAAHAYEQATDWHTRRPPI
jgi:aspartyl-tRNA(Asn)/glutamyl-tRNA(Gln) amidotransferase subunit A